MGVLDWNASFKIESELNEKVFNQDLNGDGSQSSGVSEETSTLSSLVNAGTTDAEVLAKFGNSAQSDIISIKSKACLLYTSPSPRD